MMQKFVINFSPGTRREIFAFTAQATTVAKR